MTTCNQYTDQQPVQVILPGINVYRADRGDKKWMTRLYFEAANKGHFSLTVKNDIALIKRNIKSLIDKQVMVDFQLETQTLVFEHNNKRIGYVVISAVRGEPDSVEIHLLIVDTKFRCKSYGSYILNEVISRWHPSTNIYARCYSASSIMKNMLINAGFSLTKTLEDTSCLYVLNKQAVEPFSNSFKLDFNYLSV